MPELEFSVSEALDIIQPLALLLAEILIYSVFVFGFYRFVASRDIIAPNLNQGYSPFVNSLLYLLQHFLAFPILAVCWCAAFVCVLALLGSEQSVENILLVSVALISTIRATAYVTEDLSKDLAKMLPFAVLGLFLVDKSYISLELSWGVIEEVPDHWEVIVYYVIFVVVLEFTLRLINGLICAIFGNKVQQVPCKPADIQVQR